MAVERLWSRGRRPRSHVSQRGSTASPVVAPSRCCGPRVRRRRCSRGVDRRTGVHRLGLLAAVDAKLCQSWPSVSPCWPEPRCGWTGAAESAPRSGAVDQPYFDLAGPSRGSLPQKLYLVDANACSCRFLLNPVALALSRPVDSKAGPPRVEGKTAPWLRSPVRKRLADPHVLRLVLRHHLRARTSGSRSSLSLLVVRRVPCRDVTKLTVRVFIPTVELGVLHPLLGASTSLRVSSAVRLASRPRGSLMDSWAS